MQAAKSQRACSRVVDAACTGGKVDQQAVTGNQLELFLSQDGRRDGVEDELLLRQQGVHLRKRKGGQPKAARQRQVLWAAGLTPMQALGSATIDAAELLRMKEDIGSLEAGKYADLVAFDGDPMEDITVMTRPDLVMKGGVIYKQNGQPTLYPLL